MDHKYKRLASDAAAYADRGAREEYDSPRPSCIQPHGYLFILNPADLTVAAASTNVAAALLVSMNDIIGRPVAEFLLASGSVSLEDAFRSPIHPPPLLVQFRQGAVAAVWDCERRTAGDFLLVELNIRLGSGMIGSLLTDTLDLTERIRTAGSTALVSQLLAQAIQRLTGFGHVMIYRLPPGGQTPEGKGQIVAEVRDDGIRFWNGTVRPDDYDPEWLALLATDSSLQIIPHVAAIAVPVEPPVMPSTGRPIDLRATSLKTAPPDHLAYLMTIDVAAAMSIGMIRQGHLWGVVICHHPTALSLARPIPQLCRFLTQMAAWIIAERHETAAARNATLVRELDVRVSDLVETGQDYRSALSAIGPDLLTITATHGIAVCQGHAIWATGQVPLTRQILDLVQFLSDGNAASFNADRLSDTVPAAAHYHDIACAVAARKLPDGWLLLFRAGVSGQSAEPPEAMPWMDHDLLMVAEVHLLVLRILRAGRAKDVLDATAGLAAKIQQLRTVTDQVPALIVYRDSDNRFVFMNRTAEHWLALRLDAAEGKTALQCHLPEPWLRPVAAVPSREEQAIDFPDGETRIVDIARIADIGRGGQLLGEVVLAVDVSERHAQESQRRQAQTLEAISTLTGGMAHDLNNLLGIVIGNLDLLKRLVGSDPIATELCDEALLGAHRGCDLIRRLVAFARIQPLRPKPVDVNTLVDNAVGLLRRTLGQGIRLTLALDDTLWTAIADPAELEKALLHLAANAHDAMPAGGQLLIATQNVVLDEAYVRRYPDVRPGPYVLIEVGDTGIGIAPEIIGRIFEPFFTTKSAGKGVGLGLSVIFGFVKQSGGHLSVESDPGQSTIFRLYLPRYDAAPATPDPEPTADPVARGNETVLVVEDNAQLRQTTERQLVALGYAVHVADQADRALGMLQDGNRFDLLFTDVMMPGRMDGIELAQRAQTLQPTLKVLLTSGFSGVRDGHSRLVDASLPFLNKPYQRDELARAVRDALDREPADDLTKQTRLRPKGPDEYAPFDSGR